MHKKISKFIKANKYIYNILGKIEIKEQLGQGGTSIVRRAILNDKQEFAIKFLLENINDSKSKAYKRFKQAHINLLTIKNTGAVLPQIHFDSIEIDEDTKIPYIIMLKADKTLKEYVNDKKDIDFETFEKIYHSILKLLEIIHQNKIIHRDLKPENIFILNDKLILGDFDIAKFDDENHIKLHDTKENERLANYYFSAPEQSDKQYEEITETADLYAFGQILYWLVTRKVLRGQAQINLMQYDNRYSKYDKLIAKLLLDNPKNRLQSINEIKKFMQNIDEEAIEHKRREKKFNKLIAFDEIIDKYTPDIFFQEFQKFDSPKDINDIMQDLSDKCDLLDLWWSQGYRDYYIKRVKKYKSLTITERLKDYISDLINKNTKWILGNFEVDVNSIWIYKYGDAGGSFMIIESKAMKSFGIFKNKYNTEDVALCNNKYIPISHYDNGWTLDKHGNRIKIDFKNCETRRRYMQKEIFFIAPTSGPLTDKENTFIIDKIYKEYKNGKDLSKIFLKPLKNIRRKYDIVMYS